MHTRRSTAGGGSLIQSAPGDASSVDMRYGRVSAPLRVKSRAHANLAFLAFNECSNCDPVCGALCHCRAKTHTCSNSAQTRCETTATKRGLVMINLCYALH